MDYTEFESLLKQAMGLDAASIGSSAIGHAVQVRMSACELTDMPAYLELVHASATELQELIEAVVVPETWFFRDREAFAALARIAAEEWLRTHTSGVMRLLSLPCSSGEEPYSMAMALLDAGFPASLFHIDAVDISARVLTHAKRGVYGKNSFRGDRLDFRDRYFESTAHGHRLNDTVRQQVSFHHANLFAPNFLPGTEIYDIIFCRNLLIYFDRSTQDSVVRVLQRLLKAKGVLFVGPSETGLMLIHDFASAKVPLAFAFRKIDVAARATAPASARPARPLMRPPVAPPPAPKKTSPPPRLQSATPAASPRHGTLPAPAAKLDGGMEKAAALADQGRLAEAEKACEEQLRSHGPSTQAFYLLGLIRDASGNLPEAAQYYRKALYLDPSHLECLTQLAFLLEKQGDDRGALVLRNRVSRAEPKRAK
ncbi:MAG TPA: CheR family methyltransferase [Methylophilaceae bacterium]|nr:CheR family methyltransferase [Methylophilaceae bacterium]